MPTAEHEVELLLLDLFGLEELRRFLRAGPEGEALERDLPGPTASPASFAHAAVRALRRRGILDSAFFQRLAAQRPGRAPEILSMGEGLCSPGAVKREHERHAASGGAQRAADRQTQGRQRANRPATRAPDPAVRAFILTDHPYTFYPLKVSRLLVERTYDALGRAAEAAASPRRMQMQAQEQIRPAKPRNFLRTTVQLDPIASYLLYDLVYRSRSAFERSRSGTRLAFGNAFEDGVSIPGSDAWGEYQHALAEARLEYREALSFDIATYFNHIRAPRLASWFASHVDKPEDAARLEGFMAAVGTLPQGVYPAKVLGSRYLSFVDEASRLRSSRILRFMDDFTLFDEKAATLHADFERVQVLLDTHGLSLNERKTVFPESPRKEVVPLDPIRGELLRLRRRVVTDVSGVEEENEYETEEAEEQAAIELTEEQRGYLVELLQEDSLSEEDAEMILTLMQRYRSDVVEHVEALIRPYPNLAKRVYSFFRRGNPPEVVADVVLRYLEDSLRVGEYELFWFAALLENSLRWTPQAERLYRALLDADAASPISRARVYQIDERRFGLPDEREDLLRRGGSDWPTWSAAVGSRGVRAPLRHDLFERFRAGSELNSLIATAALELPPSSHPLFGVRL